MNPKNISHKGAHQLISQLSLEGCMSCVQKC